MVSVVTFLEVFLPLDGSFLFTTAIFSWLKTTLL